MNQLHLLMSHCPNQTLPGAAIQHAAVFGTRSSFGPCFRYYSVPAGAAKASISSDFVQTPISFLRKKKHSFRKDTLYEDRECAFMNSAPYNPTFVNKTKSETYGEGKKKTMWIEIEEKARLKCTGDTTALPQVIENSSICPIIIYCRLLSFVSFMVFRYRYLPLWNLMASFTRYTYPKFCNCLPHLTEH